MPGDPRVTSQTVKTLAYRGSPVHASGANAPGTTALDPNLHVTPGVPQAAKLDGEFGQPLRKLADEAALLRREAHGQMPGNGLRFRGPLR
jgi:hypothetical protein